MPLPRRLSIAARQPNARSVTARIAGSQPHSITQDSSCSIEIITPPATHAIRPATGGSTPATAAMSIPKPTSAPSIFEKAYRTSRTASHVTGALMAKAKKAFRASVRTTTDPPAYQLNPIERAIHPPDRRPRPRTKAALCQPSLPRQRTCADSHNGPASTPSKQTAHRYCSPSTRLEKP
jgi:hypothetical protein